MLSRIVRESIRFLLIGVVSAWVSSIIVRGRIVRPRGCFPFMLFGLTGALAGGWLMNAFGLSDVMSVVASVIGAIAFLVFLQFARNA